MKLLNNNDNGMNLQAYSYCPMLRIYYLLPCHRIVMPSCIKYFPWNERAPDIYTICSI
jgi:hypothetical protein